MSTYDLFQGPMRTFSISGLRSALIDGFTVVGMGREEAHLVGGSLIESELRGNPTHGLMRFAWYIKSIQDGVLTPVDRGALQVARSASAVTVHCTGNLGYLPTMVAVEELTGMAREAGIAIGFVNGISEFGRASYYSRQLADRGLIGIVMQNTMALIKAPGGSQTVVGNNPLAYSVPGVQPLTFDAAFTARSGGELHLRRILGVPIDEDWGYTDKDGSPTTDPNAALQTAQEAVGGAKGFGIAVLIDLLAGALAGARSNVDIRPGYPDVGATIIAIEPTTVGASQGALDSAATSLHDAIVGSGGRWLGARSDQDLAQGERAGHTRIPLPILDEVNRALATLGLNQLVGEPA